MSEELEVAIVFADVVGSTQLYETLGDDAAREVVRKCLEIMINATESNGGTVIKTMGDEVMSIFDEADAAINASVQMQKQISDGKGLVPDGQSIAIRIGCHYGIVAREPNDIFGAAVHTANRMTSQAKARQIVTTGSTVDLLSDTWGKQARQIDLAVVKGKKDEVALFEILWQQGEEATSMLPTIGWSQNSAEQRLTLSFGGRQMRIDPSRQQITLGRAEDNDIVVKGNLISRVHARIEKRRNKYFLVDESTNGSFLLTIAGSESFVRRDSIELVGEGIIGLGKVAKPGTPLAVHYMLEAVSETTA
ncbi:MAG: adenylate/guanylate cyclase domain-containing protein [Pseudomonadota bacterium]